MDYAIKIIGVIVVILLLGYLISVGSGKKDTKVQDDPNAQFLQYQNLFASFQRKKKSGCSSCK